MATSSTSRSRAFDPEFDWESKLLFTEHHQSHAVSAFFGRPARKPEERLEQHMDLAASIGAVTKEIMLRLTRSIAAKAGAENLCRPSRLDGGGHLWCYITYASRKSRVFLPWRPKCGVG